MRIVRTGRRDSLELKSGGGWFILFGLPFLAAGLGIMCSSLGLIGGDGDLPVAVGIPFGAVFATVGAFFVFGRRGCSIMPSDDRVSLWWGLLTPIRRRDRRLSEFTRVTLTREVRSSGKSSHTVYPVRLASAADKLTVSEPRSCEQARTLAEQVAKLVRLPLEDSSVGETTVREPGELDEPLRDRLRRTGAVPEMPPAPATLRTSIRRKGRTILLEIPASGFGRATRFLKYAAFVPGLVFFFIVFSALPKDEPLVVVIFGAFIAVFFVLLPLIVVTVHRKKRGNLGGEAMRVFVSPADGLRIERGAGRGGPLIEMPASELEELVVMSPPAEAVSQAENVEIPAFARGLISIALGTQTGLVARSDRAIFRFGAGLPVDECRYLHALILRTLAG